MNIDAPANLRPELASGFAAFSETFWTQDGCPAETIELCRLRIAAIHGCEPEWQKRHPDVSLAQDTLTALQAGDFSDFSESERAALNIAEVTPFNHHGMTDDDVRNVESHLGSAAAVTVLTACAFFDTTCRWQIVLPATR